ncbi:MAG: chorismate-binding protein [Chitinophagales bacterium]|nr:chorismate-binding protein [Chitinophagales bacterium]
MSFAVVYHKSIKKIHYFVSKGESTSSLFIDDFNKSKALSLTQTNQDEFFAKFKDFELLDFDKIIIDEAHSKLEIKHYIEHLKAHKDLLKLVGFIQKEFPTIEKESMITYFQNLIQAFPDCLIYLFGFEGKIWIGASPELIGLSEDKQFKTIAIAGTKDLNEAFEPKETLEQNIVEQEIYQILKTYHHPSLDFREEKYSNIKHLVSEFQIPLDDQNLFSEIIHKIHPSSALVGAPKLSALEFLKQVEKSNREFYCGLIHLKTKEIELAYGIIRVMVFYQNKSIAYAGAGLLDKSDADSELLEMQTKINTFTQFLPL